MVSETRLPGKIPEHPCSQAEVHSDEGEKTREKQKEPSRTPLGDAGFEAMAVPRLPSLNEVMKTKRTVGEIVFLFCVSGVSLLD